MKIEYVILHAEKKYQFEFSNHVNLITDFSGGGKTLLFKLIEFVLGSSGNNIDVKEAKKIYPGLKSIEMCMLKENSKYIFIRDINKKNNKILCNDKEINAEYANFLNGFIDHSSIKVIKSKKEMELSTFTLREYIKALFFNEARLTSEESLLTNEYSARTKYRNFYRYLVTGKTVSTKEVQKANAEIKLVDAINRSFDVIKNQISEPTQEEKRLYKNLIVNIEKAEKSLNESEKLINQLSNDKNLKVINIERLTALNQLFESRIEDFISAAQFKNYMKEYYIVCDCGKKIYPVNCNYDDKELARLKSQSEDVKNQININVKEVNLITRQILNEQEKKKKHRAELDELKSKSEILLKKLSDYDAFLKLSSVFKVKKREMLQHNDISKEEELIDETFNEKIAVICNNATNRLKAWKLPMFNKVTFDIDNFDFRFDGTLRYHLAKGYRNICTTAVIIEILLNAIELGINSLQTIMIDTIWSHLYIENMDVDTIIESAVKNLENEKIQFIIMENKISSNHTNKTRIFNLKEMKG